MRPTVILSVPFSGDFGRELIYVKRAIRDSLARGEAPLNTTLFYSQVTDDDSNMLCPSVLASRAWEAASSALIVYEDYGISAIMVEQVDLFRSLGRPVLYRKIGKNEKDLPTSEKE